MSAHLVDGMRIRRLRASRQWSQADLSQASGVDQGVISRMENNQQKHTRIGTIAALARALGVPTDSLLTSSAPVPTEPVDLQAMRLVHLFRQMTPEERHWAELYSRFMIAERNLPGHWKVRGQKRLSLKRKGGISRPSLEAAHVTLKRGRHDAGKAGARNKKRTGYTHGS